MKPKPTIQLHIERLAIDASLIPGGGGAIVGEAVAGELTRLIDGRGLPPGLAGSQSVSEIDAGTVEIGRDVSPRQLGTQIAGQMYRGIGR